MISIHAPREGGDHFPFYQKQKSNISIHAPREGGDAKWALMGNRYIISIHAPREGGDTFGMSMSLVTTDFNPRPPRGGRPYAVNGYQKELDISIHAPREGGDCIAPNQNYYDQSISIHAPREGGDSSCL